MTEQNQQYLFRMDKTESPLKKEHTGFMSELYAYVDSSLPISTQDAYVEFISGVAKIIGSHKAEFTMNGEDSKIFDTKIPRVGKHELKPKTDWGGVSFFITSEPENHVEKYLLVKQSITPVNVLGFERHEKKDEHLLVKEGIALFVSSEPDAMDGKIRRVTLRIALPGDTITLHPGNIHGVFAVSEKLTLMETSTYDLDIEDLIYVFRPVKASEYASMN